jgi:hypothetical protein
VVVISAVLPLLFWLSAAAGSLVLLRRGFRTPSVIAWGCCRLDLWSWAIPALLVLLGRGLALVLRAGILGRVLLVSVVLGWCFQPGAGSALAQIEVLARRLQAMPAKPAVSVVSKRGALIAGPAAVMLQIVSVLSLMLGAIGRRCCTTRVVSVASFAHLNPAGPGDVAAGADGAGPFIGSQFIMLASFAAYRWCWPAGPDSRAGGAEATGRFWLVGLYVTLLLFMQLIYPLLVVLAIVDSLIDFRGRLVPKDADNANGEG